MHSLQEYLDRQQRVDLLRFITCGSVDDGKSTLIGRLLWESQQILDDQLNALRQDSLKHGTQQKEIDFALLVDGLMAEREQKITIDVAHRFFATARRRFIVLDTPGHEQYTRNMVTGASIADVAVILVDASKGITVQTRRHAYLASLMGIRHIALAVNKMDLVCYNEKTFSLICEAFKKYAQNLNFESIATIPLSALKGENITQPSESMPWHKGPTLMDYLETVKITPSRSNSFIFPIQSVCRPDANFRGFAGTIAEGKIKVGDEICVALSGQKAKIARIVTMDGDRPDAEEGKAVTLTLDREIDASRGDVFSLSEQPLNTTTQFKATLIWMNEEAGVAGRSYDLKIASQETTASITSIKHKLDIDNLSQKAATSLELNDIATCKLAVSKPIAFDAFENSKTLGSFILIDRFSRATVAAGLICYSLYRSENLHSQNFSIDRSKRERLNGHKSKVIWFTGLSGSGKSAIANALEIALHSEGYRTYILDGDNIRQGLNKDLGFTVADRVENIRRVSEVAKLMFDAGLIVITAFISPFCQEREAALELIGSENFIEIYVSTPLEECEKRDVKGLYKKARAGNLPNMSGVNSPYEPPPHPALSVDPSKETLSEIVDRILSYLAR